MSNVQIDLDLSKEDGLKLAEFVGKHQITVSELFECFIGDLIDGKRTNGSDERMFATLWFERCGFDFGLEPTLLQNLIQNDINVEEFLNTLDNIERLEMEINKYKEDPEEFRNELNDAYDDLDFYYAEFNSMTEDFRNDKTNINMKQEIDKCREWFEESKNLCGIETKKDTSSHARKNQERVFTIEIKETLSKIVEVKAKSLDEALKKTESDYKNVLIVLEPEDVKNVEFCEYLDNTTHKSKKKEIELER